MLWSRFLCTSVLCFAACSGCAQQYAILYATSTPGSVSIWSGKDGQYLGMTPAQLPYIRVQGWDPNPIAVIVFQEDKYQTTFKVVEIDKWWSDWQQARSNPNTVHADLSPIP
jgi:hypothetical protein